MLRGKGRLKITIALLFVVLLCFCYFATPVRTVIAAQTANRYIQSHYEQYDFPPAEILSSDYHNCYWFEWITDYGAQSINNPYAIWVELNGWFPFVVQSSILWETKGGETFQIDS